MPKVYFYDTGLLCYLLSIETPKQLETHPQKGAVFENMAICELLKSRLNCGKDPNLYFYREKSGLEVDVMSETSEGRRLYEIKAGKILRPEFMDNMKYLKGNLKDVNGTTVIYDGEGIPPTCVNIRDI